MAGNRRKLQEGFKAQESRTLANFHEIIAILQTVVPQTQRWVFVISMTRVLKAMSSRASYNPTTITIAIIAP